MNKLSDFPEQLIEKGKHFFALKDVQKAFPEIRGEVLAVALNRMTRKRIIAPVHKGFYVVLPLHNRRRGIIEPYNFIDQMMQALGKRYYFSLLTAASFYGAAHQQPQEFFVTVGYPAMRAFRKKGMVINYVCSSDVGLAATIRKKSEFGYINVSSPLQTAIDVVRFNKQIGGMNRAAEVIEELADAIEDKEVTADFLLKQQPGDIQRLGYLFEFICDALQMAEKLYSVSKDANVKFRSIPLKTGAKKNANNTSNRWLINVNVKVERK